MALLLAEIVLLIAFIFSLAAVKKNFFFPLAGMAYTAWFGFTQIDHANQYAYLLSGMSLLLLCGFGFAAYASLNSK